MEILLFRAELSTLYLLFRNWKFWSKKCRLSSVLGDINWSKRQKTKELLMPGVRSWNSVSFSLISLLTGAGTGSLPRCSWFVPRFPCVRSGGNNCFCYSHVVRSVVRALNARAQEIVVAGNSVRPGILSPIVAQNLWSMCGRCYWLVVFLITCQIPTDRLRSCKQCKKYIKLDIGKTIIFVVVVLFEPRFISLYKNIVI